MCLTEAIYLLKNDNQESRKLETRVITLNYGEKLDESVFRIQKDWTVRFVRGVSLLGRNVDIFTSISGKIPWKKGADEFATFAEIKCDRSGAFSYYFVADNENRPAGSGYILVMPNLSLNNHPLQLNAVTCITHISKLLGKFDMWKERLKVAAKAGYNMIHFTPVQQLGISNSSYCIADPMQLNPDFSTLEKKYTYDDLELLIETLEKDYHLLSIQDVVWNHAARNATWLLEHPQCAYNLKNSPHLRPAYVLDRLLYHFGLNIMNGKYKDRNLDEEINTDEHLRILLDILRNEILPQLRVHEFFQVDIDNLTAEFENYVKEGASCDVRNEMLESKPGLHWNRFGFTVDLDHANKIFNRERSDASDESDRRRKCLEAFRCHLQFLNQKALQSGAEICENVLSACAGHIGYERIDPSGPRLPKLTELHGLLTQYFVQPFPSLTSWKDEETFAYNDETAEKVMACNGWVMNDNPLLNFAHYPSQVYLMRHLVCWGDCIKLNYGEKPEDCPYLWSLMKKYTQRCAKIFHGLRIDNCHSTPIHVAEYLLKAAREIRPDIYVTAELFTQNENLDNIFVNRLGITSLIREAQNAAVSFEQGRFIYRYGGDVFGGFIQRTFQDATSSVAPAFFFDQTHDNPPAILKRSVYDCIPTAAMLAMANCAVGTVRGYDELVPYQINVVNEMRSYTTWNEAKRSLGIISARATLNRLHIWLTEHNFSQIYVDQRTPDIIAITRHNPVTHEKVIMLAFTAFNKHEICHDCPAVEDLSFTESVEKIVGLNGAEIAVREHLKCEESKLAIIEQYETSGKLHLKHFPSGSVIVIKVSPIKKAAEAIKLIRDYLSGKNDFVKTSFLFVLLAEVPMMLLDEPSENRCVWKNYVNALKQSTLQTYNTLLFRCAAEDQDDFGSGSYNVPHWKTLDYCGLQGLLPYLNDIRFHNDLGHPICQNLRDGLWLCKYIYHRLEKRSPFLTEIARIIRILFSPLHDVPYDLRPCYFEALFSLIYETTLEQLMKKLSRPFVTASVYVQTLALSSVSFLGAVKNAKLALLPEGYKTEDELPSSLSAGLPHFATGIWRNWGRDTFIALPGCCLVTGRFQDARNLILSFGGALRHGIIPNLLDGGYGARYNARDAVWFWLYAIVKYIEMAPEGVEILKSKVLRIFIHDDTVYGHDLTEQSLADTMQEALRRHFIGIEFVERNAGRGIDEHMQEPGFHVKAYVDHNTGFVMGGNEFNCGTWMDKMGSSEKAGNKGWPATPRDGAAVELQGLCYAVIQKLEKLHQKKLYPYEGVFTEDKELWTWQKWANIMKNNFEHFFYVTDDDLSKYVNKRGIIKDTYGSTHGYTDYQLRPNFPITLAVAPRLMSAEKAWHALQIAEKELLGPLGIKTLDPSDFNYCSFYNQDDDGTEKRTARGWSYHQGPEWLWVAMFFYRAKLAIAKVISEDRNDTEFYEKSKRFVRSRMGAYWDHLKSSSWASLPELTNANGAPCYYSCGAQAWSIGCMLETVNDLYELDKF
uniref:Glycogen debranching enzyme n=1 Tax=Setaria digitata TaxID=48799 RepID=A0A915PP57_9BILA